MTAKGTWQTVLAMFFLWTLSACNFLTTAPPKDLLLNPTEETASTQEMGEITTLEPIRATPGNAATLLHPADLTYLGAFRLPDDRDRPYTFEYGGNAMTYSPMGDPKTTADEFPGSLFVMGHDRLPYGEMPDGNRVAELAIPAPLISKEVNTLPIAEFLQPFSDVAHQQFTTLNEMPRVGLAYLDTPLTGALIHITWGAHFQEEEADAPSHGWFSPDLADSDFQGEWYLKDTSLYSVNGYLFAIPLDWADQFAEGMPLASGRYRDGGWSGMGPALYAYQPWLPDGSPAPSGAELPAIPLLQYETSYTSEDLSHALNQYSHADEWEGGAWLTDGTGRSAVIFVGTKSVGEKYWYGWQNPQGSEIPCIETEMRDEFTTCRLANGTPCPAEDLQGCDGHNDYRGWWSSEFRAQMLFYNPDDLARVAAGVLSPWEPQPYAILDIDNNLFHNPDNVESDMLGSGLQRRARIGDAAYDSANGFLYVLELFADGAKPVVHVWQINNPN